MPEEIEVHKHQRDTSSLSAATWETYLTGVTRVIVTPETHIPMKKGKYKIPSFFFVYSWI